MVLDRNSATLGVPASLECDRLMTTMAMNYEVKYSATVSVC